jgi:hypothetical protein
MRSRLMGWAKRTAKGPAALYILLAVFVTLLTLHNLSSQPSGINHSELAAKNGSQSLDVIKNNPVNAPHDLLAKGLHTVGLGWLSSLRLASVIFGICFALCAAFILISWFGRVIGFMGALLFIATPLFLIASRQGSAEIMLFSITAVIASYIWILRSRNKDFGLILLFIICCLAAYVPAVALWLIGAAIICRKKLTDNISSVSPLATTVALLLSVLLLMPLVLGLVSDWHIAKSFLPLPAHFARPLIMLKETVWMGLAIFIKTPYHTDFLLARLPILNIIQDALIIFGCYALWQHAAKKLAVLVAGIGFAVIAAGINNDIGLLALAVFPLAVIVCAGIRYLYIEWLGVFPLNPVARGFAYTLLWAAVVIQLLFGIRYAVVAWPVTSSTKATYVIK